MVTLIEWRAGRHFRLENRSINHEIARSTPIVIQMNVDVLLLCIDVIDLVWLLGGLLGLWLMSLDFVRRRGHDNYMRRLLLVLEIAGESMLRLLILMIVDNVWRLGYKLLCLQFCQLL